MSNYIKIEMEDGKTLTGATLTTSGGGTIAGYDARNGVEVFTSTGEGSGATINVTMDGRGLSSVPLTGWGGSVGNGSQSGATTADGTGGSGSGSTDPTFNVVNNATDLEVTLATPGDNLKVDDVITIAADTTSGNSRWSVPLTYTVTESDLVAATETDLEYTIANGGTGYANGDVLFLDIQGSGPANEIAWSAVIEMTVSGLTGYDDGPFVLIPIDNAWCCGVNNSGKLGPMTGSTITIIYQEYNANNNQAGYPGADECTITFSGVTTDAQRKIIMENLNSVIAQASAAENSQPYLTMPAGVKGVEVSF